MQIRSTWLVGLAIAAVAAPAAAQAPARARGIDRANMDTTCAACENFYEFANGAWLKRTEIPAAYSRWGSFESLGDKNEGVLRQIVEGAAATLEPVRRGGGTPDRVTKVSIPVADLKNGTAANVARIGTFYRSCMDSAAAEKAGLSPIQPLLSRIDAIRTRDDMKRALGELEHEAGLAPFGQGPGPDAKDSKQLIVNVGQGGLGLPDRDIYLVDNPRFKGFRDAYVAHAAKLLVLAGAPAEQAKADAERVLALETKLAQASMPRVQMRDPNAVYHKMSLDSLQKLTPGFAWRPFFKAVGAPEFTHLNVLQPDFVKALDGLMTDEPVETWKAYFRVHALHNTASALSAAFVNENFAFQSQFSGAKEQQPRAKRCTQLTNGALGEAVGQEYVRRTFSEQDKARANAMVKNLRAALAERIQGLTWMSDATKKEALAKLTAFTQKIGFPDKWRDYSDLQVVDGPFVENLRRVNHWASARNWAKVGKPIDKTEWLMTPPTVNAYYNPSWNEIVFPAGILQPPFYDPNADDAVNYGAMGAVIGHEMTHGFDDQGRQFDASGNLRDWWAPEDATKYTAEANKVVEQFNAYTVIDTATRVNGKLTLGENIADFGGLTVAYAAMQKAYAGKPRPKVDGFTPEQRFFLGWAQVWRANQREAAQRSRIMTDPHSPGVWRVNGPLSNMPEFKAAWGCKDGDKMVRPADQRPKIW
jgi:putative endopeptidase